MYRLLIADNHPEWREFSAHVLRENGYAVVLADTLNDLEMNLANNGYDLILVNVDLVRGELREPSHRIFLEYSNKPIIVVSIPSSVYQTVQDTRVAFKIGARDCVNKPFSSDKLLTLVQDSIEEFMGKFRGTQGALI